MSMTPRRLTAWAVAGAVAATVLSGGGGHAATVATRHTTRVAIQNFQFVPATLSVKIGTTIVWTNKDAAPHTVTVTGGTVDSGPLAQGKTFRHLFTRPGTYHYLCTIHPFMVATIVVHR